jgi:hypothetical protein
MLTHAALDQLRALRLDGTAHAFIELDADSASSMKTKVEHHLFTRFVWSSDSPVALRDAPMPQCKWMRRAPPRQDHIEYAIIIDITSRVTAASNNLSPPVSRPLASV